jgi:hypothetical protein
VTQFLLEVFAPRSRAGDFAAKEKRARAAAKRVSGSEAGVRYLRAIYVPEDETCFYVFEAPSAQLVAQAGAVAGLGDGSIVEAFERSASPSGARRSMKTQLLFVGVAFASAGLLVAGCTGSDDQQSPPAKQANTASSRYIAVLERTHTRAQRLFGKTVEPCLARRYALCGKYGRPARAAAQALLNELELFHPPVRARTADRNLRDAFRALVAGQDLQGRAIEAHDDGLFSRSISDITVAINEIEAARVEINDVLPAVDLPPIH